MAVINSTLLSSRAAAILLVFVAVATVQSQTRVMAQTCTSELTSLNTCAPFVVPGAANPSPDCCAALQSVQTDCLCNTLRIASQLPSRCNIPPLNCGTMPVPTNP